MSARKLSFIAGFFAGAAVALAAAAWAQSQARVVWHWPESMEAVRAAPKNHKVLFENDHVRLLEVRVQPGETENMHGHIWPSVFAFDAVQPKGTNRIIDSDTQHTAASLKMRIGTPRSAERWVHRRHIKSPTWTSSPSIFTASNSNKWTASPSNPGPPINSSPDSRARSGERPRAAPARRGLPRPGRGGRV
jgi:hypothetical protein